MIDVTLTSGMMGNPIYFGMSPNSKNLYILLLSMRETNESDHAVCTYRQIRELLGVCNATARNSIKELEFRGFIKLSKELSGIDIGKRKEFRVSNVFYFIDDWKR